MSADNWALCPRCLKRALEERERKRAVALAAYGQVGVDEFEALRAAAEAPIDLGPMHTFREDWELGLVGEIYALEETTKPEDVEGSIVLIYQGKCTACGLAYEHRQEVALDLETGKAVGS